MNDTASTPVLPPSLPLEVEQAMLIAKLEEDLEVQKAALKEMGALLTRAEGARDALKDLLLASMGKSNDVTVWTPDGPLRTSPKGKEFYEHQPKGN